MLDMFNMMGKVKEMQARMKEAQDQLELLTTEAESGAGMVKVKVNGKKQILQIQIDPSLLTADQVAIVQDLLVAAINKAQDEAEELARQSLAKATEGMLPNIPGMDLGSLFNK
ncbi:MAG: YbaB/EbfC family nucleoid-associated protein [Spirosomataceae bacterium]